MAVRCLLAPQFQCARVRPTSCWPAPAPAPARAPALLQYTSQLSRYTPQRERLAREHRQLADPWELRVAAFKRNTFRTANISMQLFDQLPGLIAEKRVHARTRGPIGLHLQVAKDRIPLAHHDDAARLIAGGIKPNTFYGFVAPDGKTSRALNEWTTAPGSKEGVSVFEVSPDSECSSGEGA